MVQLIPIQYSNRRYPQGIKPEIQEIAGHFDVGDIHPIMPYSLHTEYSYGARNYTSSPITNLSSIKRSNKNGVPQLWFDSQWVEEFIQFISILTHNQEPHIIEIHPPFNDYCRTIEEFIERYMIFEEKVLALHPTTEILIENRSGSQYRGGKFLISRDIDLINLVEQIKLGGLKLKIALDVPQYITAYGDISKLNIYSINCLFQPIKPYAQFISCIHLWGKRRNKSSRWISHIGNLNTYFEDHLGLKLVFLNSLYDLLDDGRQRYFVPEINSGNEDLASIVNDLIGVGFTFK